MLKNTFMHVPGIGPATEQKLWGQGLVFWEDYLNTHEPFPLPPVLHRQTIEHLEESARALTVNHARHFETCLPAGEMWRLYREFGDNVAFLDIETTGLFAGPDAITVIGLFDGHKTMVFVQGHNLQEFRQEIKRYSLIVTFNGKRFDLPFIRYALGNLPDYQAHIDLLYPLRKLGYHGGLKSIEAQLGLERDGALKEADGFMAVLLWREYRRGNRTALDTLIRCPALARIPTGQQSRPRYADTLQP